LLLTLRAQCGTPLTHTHIKRTDTDVKALSDAELNQQVFQSIADDKAHITVKDLLGWDLVHIMLAEVKRELRGLLCVQFSV